MYNLGHMCCMYIVHTPAMRFMYFGLSQCYTYCGKDECWAPLTTVLPLCQHIPKSRIGALAAVVSDADDHHHCDQSQSDDHPRLVRSCQMQFHWWSWSLWSFLDQSDHVRCSSCGDHHNSDHHWSGHVKCIHVKKILIHHPAFQQISNKNFSKSERYSNKNVPAIWSTPPMVLCVIARMERSMTKMHKT